jgi:hypothetical protein
MDSATPSCCGSLILLLSPAKTLDFETILPAYLTGALGPTRPICAPHKTVALVEALRAMPEDELGARLKVSPALAALNARRFRAFDAGVTGRSALFAFNGDAYKVTALLLCKICPSNQYHSRSCFSFLI